MVPSAPGALAGSSIVEQEIALLVADLVALAAAIAELAEIAVDRDLRRLAFLGARDDVEHRVLAGDLLEHALGDVEDDRRTRGARADAHEIAGIVAHRFGLGVARRVDGGRVGRAEDQDPVALGIGLAGLGRRFLLARHEGLLFGRRLDDVVFFAAPGSLISPVEIPHQMPMAATRDQRHAEKDRRRSAGAARWRHWGRRRPKPLRRIGRGIVERRADRAEIRRVGEERLGHRPAGRRVGQPARARPRPAVRAGAIGNVERRARRASRPEAPACPDRGDGWRAGRRRRSPSSSTRRRLLDRRLERLDRREAASEAAAVHGRRTRPARPPG